MSEGASDQNGGKRNYEEEKIPGTRAHSRLWGLPSSTANKLRAGKPKISHSPRPLKSIQKRVTERTKSLGFPPRAEEASAAQLHHSHFLYSC